MPPQSASSESMMRHHFQPLYAIPKASFLYPIKGFFYFISHPYLWPLLRARLLPCFLLSTFVLVNLFLWTYLPQVAFLALFHSKGAWINGTFLVLGEGAAIVSLLFEAFFVDETQVDVFDAVLVEQGLEDLVARRRPVAAEGDDPVKRLGKPNRASVYAPFSVRQIIELILFLPLNFIPVVGVPFFLVLTGRRAGPLHHFRYFKLHEWDRQQRNLFVKHRRWSYTMFGTAALIFQLLPPLSMLFLLTTPAGSALWAKDLEDQRQRIDGDAAVQPDFTDDPV